MLRASQLGILAVLCFSLPLARAADDTKKKGAGVHGKVEAVKVGEGTLTVTTHGGKARTLQVNNDTQVPPGLKDKRFHPGVDIAVVPAAVGRAAKALHLSVVPQPPINKNLKGGRVNQDIQHSPTNADKGVKGKVVGVDLKKAQITANKTFKSTPDTKFLGSKGGERKSK